MKERPILFSAPMVRALLDGRKTQTRRVVKDAPIERDGYLCTKLITFRNEKQVRGILPSLCPYGKPGDRLWVKETFYAYGYWSKHFSGELARDVWCFNDKTTESGYEYQFGEVQAVLKRASGHRGWYKRPGIFMPRHASRITLEITEVRAQRLQDISEEDAFFEGNEAIRGDGTGSGPGFKWWGWGYHDGVSRVPNGEKTYHAPDIAGFCTCHAGRERKLTAAVCAYRILWESINGAGSWDANPWVWAVTFKVVR